MTQTTIRVVTTQKWKPANYFRAIIFIMLLIVPGVLLKSAAMEWLGFFVIILSAVSIALVNSPKTMTIAEARLKLDELENLK